ncbi:MAG: AraC family transcriptional regulator [Bacteroidetes bacterium]|nr:MAG: AraC family transcriptional regulator [Bacteroidota bacterium]
MEINELKIVFYSIPVYQLFYFTIQVVIARKPSASRVFLGVFLLTITAIATFIAFKAKYSGNADALYPIIIFLVASLPYTFYRYQNGSQPGTSRNSLTELLKGYSLPIILLPVLYPLLLQVSLQHEIVLQTSRTHLALAEILPKLLLGMAATYYIYWQLKNVAKIYNLCRLSVQHPNPQRKKANLHLKNLQLIITCTAFFLSVILPAFLLGQLHEYATGVIVYNLLLLISTALMGSSALKLHSKDENKLSLNGYSVNESSLYNQNIGLSSDTKICNPFKNQAEAELLKKQIIRIMEKKKPYKDAAFGLDDLCRLLGENKRKVGYLINDIMGKNYYSLINEYRVEESIRLMESNQKKYTIETIAGMVGFRSKTSFYSAFKKFKNITPYKYRVQE